jgi:hypothetical protein
MEDVWATDGRVLTELTQQLEVEARDDADLDEIRASWGSTTTDRIDRFSGWPRPA